MACITLSMMGLPLHCPAQMKDDAMAFVQLADEAADFQALMRFERLMLGCDDVHGDGARRDAQPQGTMKLADHHNALDLLCLRNNHLAVGERA